MLEPFTRARWRRTLVGATILLRHALGYIVGLFRFDRVVPFHRCLLGHARRAEAYTRPEHIRLAVEELGAASIKLGQILSTRGDPLAPQYQAEFVKLQDAAPPAPGAVIESTIVAEWDAPSAISSLRSIQFPLRRPPSGRGSTLQQSIAHYSLSARQLRP